MKILLASVILFCGGLKGVSQVNLNTSSDSVFLEYASPKALPGILDRLSTDPIFSIYIALSVSVDRDGLVNRVEMYPIFGLGNNFSENDSIWKLCESSILDVTHKWRFRPVFWENDNVGGLIDHVNQNPNQRPFGGLQSQLIICRFSRNDLEEEYNNFYLLNSRF